VEREQHVRRQVERRRSEIEKEKFFSPRKSLKPVKEEIKNKISLSPTLPFTTVPVEDDHRREKKSSALPDEENPTEEPRSESPPTKSRAKKKNEKKRGIYLS